MAAHLLLCPPAFVLFVRARAFLVASPRTHICAALMASVSVFYPCGHTIAARDPGQQQSSPRFLVL